MISSRKFVASAVSATSLTLSTALAAPIDNTWSQFHAGNSFAGAAAVGPDLRVYSTPRFTTGSDLGAYGFGPNSSSPIVMNNKVIAYSASGAVSAFSEIDGSPLWSTPIAPAAFGSWASPSADPVSNAVYMGSGSNVYKLNADTGATEWVYQLSTTTSQGETYADVVNAAPTVVPSLGLNGEGLVFQQTFGSFGGGSILHAINIADGSRAWDLELTSQGQGEVAYNPTDGLIYTTVGTEGSWESGRGGIAAINATTGTIAWYSTDSFEPLSFGGVAYDAANNRVVAGGYDFGWYAGMLVVDGTTGATISYTGDDTAPSGDYRPTIGDDDLIYVAGAEFQDGPFVFAFNAVTGAEVWQSDIGWGNWTHSVTYAGDIGGAVDVIYSGGQWGTQLGMFDADTGELLVTIPYSAGPAAIANGNVYVLTATGELLAFGPALVPEPLTATLGLFGVLLAAAQQRRR